MMLSDDNPNEKFMTPGGRAPRAIGRPGTTDVANPTLQRISVPNAATSAARMGGGEVFAGGANDLGSATKVGQAASRRSAGTTRAAIGGGRTSPVATGGSNSERGASARRAGGGGGTPSQAGGPGPQFRGLAPGRATPRPSGGMRGAGPAKLGSAGVSSGRGGGGSGSTRSAGVARGSRR